MNEHHYEMNNPEVLVEIYDSCVDLYLEENGTDIHLHMPMETFANITSKLIASFDEKMVSLFAAGFAFEYALPNQTENLISQLNDQRKERIKVQEALPPILLPSIVREVSMKWNELRELANTGKADTDSHNSGSHNSGDWNKSSYVAGCFNTEKHDLLFFDKPT